MALPASIPRAYGYNQTSCKDLSSIVDEDCHSLLVYLFVQDSIRYTYSGAIGFLIVADIMFQSGSL